MSQISWPARAEVAALGRLLCRPAPPVVAAPVLRAAGSLEALSQGRIAPRRDPSLEAGLRAAIERWRRAGGSLVTFYDAAYPELLRQIARPPVALFVRGDASWLAAPQVAIVGARAATGAARAWTQATAGDLARCGIVIASGLARGIDAAAHRGALEAGGATIAVLGCGPDLCYPPEHAALADHIAVHGCVASEYPPGTPPRPWHFPMRNRILSGLASGVVVVQAESKSGALITALQALDENRQVMAVPGDVGDPRSRGPHALLRQGAALVDGAADILSVLGWIPGATPGATSGAARGAPQGTLALDQEPPSHAPPPARVPSDAPPAGLAPSPPALAPAAAELWRALGAGLDFERLRARLGWTTAAVQEALTTLEIAGLVERVAGTGMWTPRSRC